MEMLILIKNGVFTQQRLFMVISALKIKGQLITCKIIYLLPVVFVTECKMHCFWEGFFSPFVRYFKSLISTILRMAMTMIFSSPDPKGHVSYCHQLASVVVVRRKLFQKSSPLKVLMETKLGLNHH
jgi:hypothetical protein